MMYFVPKRLAEIELYYESLKMGSQISITKSLNMIFGRPAGRSIPKQVPGLLLTFKTLIRRMKATTEYTRNREEILINNQAPKGQAREHKIVFPAANLSGKRDPGLDGLSKDVYTHLDEKRVSLLKSNGTAPKGQARACGTGDAPHPASSFGANLSGH